MSAIRCSSSSVRRRAAAASQQPDQLGAEWEQHLALASQALSARDGAPTSPTPAPALLAPDMRKDVQEIFKATPHEKQVMMFSATLSTEMRAVCKKFMQDPMEIYVDDSKLTLHGLQQHYVKLAENEKNRKLNELLDALEFNQVVVFVKSVQRANALDKLLQVRTRSDSLPLAPQALPGTGWKP